MNNKYILIIGATGATGLQVVNLLLDRGLPVKMVVRSPEKLPDLTSRGDQIRVLQRNILDLSDEEMMHLVQDCSAVISCLGHSLNIKGIWGTPRRLVTDATRRLCRAVKENGPQEPVKFILMNTAGNRNRDLPEPVSFAEKCVLGLLRFLVPPHADNEQAADYLREKMGQKDPYIEWTAVRPDTLLNVDQVTEYTLHPSPTRSAIFNAGTTSRINVAHFMVRLITEDQTWESWKGRMPVIYNVDKPL